MPGTILIVEDELAIADSIAYALRTDGFTPLHVSLGQHALDAMRSTPAPALIVLDVGLPDMNGFEVCRQLRQFCNVPVIFLTARSDEIDRIVGLEIGADDYLPKTFSSRELLARLRAVTRRSRVQIGNDAPRELCAGQLRLCEDTHTVVLGDNPLDLTTLEFAILAALLKSKGRVKTRERLIEEVSERRFDIFDRSIDVHVSSLRKKLGDDAKSPRFIRTIRGIGYSLHEPAASDFGPP